MQSSKVVTLTFMLSVLGAVASESCPHIRNVCTHSPKKVRKLKSLIRDPEAPIGEGGQAKVYKVEYKRQEVALKVLKITDLGACEGAVAELAAQRIVRGAPELTLLFDDDSCFSNDEEAVIILKLFREGDLTHFVADENMSEDKRAITLMYAILNLTLALRDLHRFRILHRDIKPDNIFVDTSYMYALADFGLAIDMPQEGDPRRIIEGSGAFIAPEIFMNRQYSPKSDYYALGTAIAVLGPKFRVAPRAKDEGHNEDIVQKFNDELAAVDVTVAAIVINSALKEPVEMMTKNNVAERPDVEVILTHIVNSIDATIDLIFADHAQRTEEWDRIKQEYISFFTTFAHQVNAERCAILRTGTCISEERFKQLVINSWPFMRGLPELERDQLPVGFKDVISSVEYVHYRDSRKFANTPALLKPTNLTIKAQIDGEVPRPSRPGLLKRATTKLSSFFSAKSHLII